MDAGIVGQHRLLDGNGAGDGIDHAGEFHQQTITSGLHDTAMVAGDDAIDALLAVRLERVQCADLIGLHQAAVMRDINRHDGGQPPFDYWHGSALHHALGFPLVPFT